MKEKHLGPLLLSQRPKLGKGEEAGVLVGGGGGDDVQAAVVWDGHGVGAPRDGGLKTVEPWLAKDGVEALEGGDVESGVVGVGGQREGLAGEEKGTVLGGAIGEMDDVGGELGSGGDVVLS